MAEVKNTGELSKIKFKYLLNQEEHVGEKGIFRKLISNLCENKFRGYLWEEYAEYLSKLGDHEKAIKIYGEELNDKEKLENEYLLIVYADPQKENELISFYEKEQLWEKLANFYHQTKRHDKAAEISQKHLDNRPKEVEQLLFHARELCAKGDHLKAMNIYHDLGKYLEEAAEWNCLGKPGTAIEVLVNYEHINEESCRKQEANYWKKVGLLSNAADAIRKFDNLASLGLRRIEANKEREIDAIVNNRLEKKLEGLLFQEKDRKMLIMKSNNEDIIERLKVYQEMSQPWTVKIAECYYRLNQEEKCKTILEEIGLTIGHLKAYMKKYGHFGKENINIIITKAYEE